MYAVIETGGKQYQVKANDTLFIEKLNVEAEDSIVFDKVVAVGGEDGLKIGTPYVDGASVRAKVIKNGKAKKITVMTYKPKKGEKKKQGHRQPYTLVEITSIDGDTTVAAKPEAAEEAKAAKKPSLKSMRKAELIEFAKENNIEIDEKATNAVMIETIEAALK